jgi:hypothetical protein
MHEIVNNYSAQTKRRLLIGCISSLVAIPLMLCCLALLPTVVFPALDRLSIGGDTKTSMFIVVGAGLISLAGLIAVPLTALVVLTLRRARSLDAVFSPLGLVGRSYMLYGRHYQGQIDGRAVDVYIYRGPTLEIRIQADIHTRLQVMPKASLPGTVAGIFAKGPLATGNPALEDFSIYPLDLAWSRGLLAESQAVEAIRTLMTLGADWAIFRHVEVQPGEVLLYLHRSRRLFSYSIEPHAQTWLNALKSLAQVAEIQPEPAVIDQSAKSSSRQSRQKLSNFLLYAVGLIVFIMPLCFIMVGVIAYLFATQFG